MPKNIIICSDGTGNSGIKDRGTNVFKLFEAIDLNGHRTDLTLAPQIAIYDDGVGTETFLPLKLLGGAFGWGMKNNVLKLYTGLVRIYDPGDNIYLFGFSRGAFTVRTLAGLIAKYGVLDWNGLPTADAMRDGVASAYASYRRGYRTALWRLLHWKTEAAVQRQAAAQIVAFRTTHQAHDADICFLGVWDTVDSVGGPFHISDVINTLFHRFKFPDYTLSHKVHSAVQALSIDDARAAFEPLLWAQNAALEQVWFAGVHANVGGGYPKQGMSLVTLDWMIRKAAAKGLRILADQRRHYAESGNVDDKLYDSRAGLGVFYRWKPRDMRALWNQRNAGGPPKMHMSALERIARGTDGYAPGTLASHVEVVFTPTGDPAQDSVAQRRALALESALRTAFRHRGASLAKVRHTVIVGRIAYYIYVASCAAVILAASVPPDAGSRLNPWTVLKHAGELLYDAATAQWGPVVESALRLLTDPVLVLTLVAGFALAAALASYVDHTRSLAFSRFWHQSRRELRECLVAIRENAPEKAAAQTAGSGGPGSNAPDQTR